MSAIQDAPLVRRLLSPGFDRWSQQAAQTGYCRHPVRLRGSSQTIDRQSGRVVGEYSTTTEPDSCMYVRCGDRRASRCPSCSRMYAGDAWHLIRAGILGDDKGVPASVREHPMVFVTVTAPSFGAVHAVSENGRRCHTRAAPGLCEHGRLLRCTETHCDDDPVVGTPLCPDCYDYVGQGLWNYGAGQLWHHVPTNAARHLAAMLGVPQRELRSVASLRFLRVIEMQRRGAVHFHIVARLDPATTSVEQQRVYAMVTSEMLGEAIRASSQEAVAVLPPVDDVDSVHELRFGSQVDVQTIGMRMGMTPPEQIAGYLAKYTTKDVGISASDSRGSWHLDRLRNCLVELAGRAEEHGVGGVYSQLRRAALELGFRGHVLSKSPLYSTTMKALRRARAEFVRSQLEEPEATPEEALVVKVSDFVWVGSGWLTTADADLVEMAAAYQMRQRLHGRGMLRGGGTDNDERQ